MGHINSDADQSRERLKQRQWRRTSSFGRPLNSVSVRLFSRFQRVKTETKGRIRKCSREDKGGMMLEREKPDERKRTKEKNATYI